MYEGLKERVQGLSTVAQKCGSAYGDTGDADGRSQRTRDWQRYVNIEPELKGPESERASEREIERDRER